MASLSEKNIGNSSLSWLPLDEIDQSCDEIFNSWCSASFLFKELDDSKKTKGLRPPQIGGIFAALGFAKSEEKAAATIVMPTGTGKTETILSIVVAGKFKKTLVIVPSDALREQTKEKFIHLGLLRQLELIDCGTSNPIVATIKHGINNEDELQEILQSNVIISSASALSLFSNQNLSKLTSVCTHLIVDEAHHITAATWARIKSHFENKPIFQFTATPFRSDRTRIGGRIIFNYPLKKAQEDGYFKPIEFHPIREFVEEKSDAAIAKKAIDLLREDIANGFDHIMMARASTIERAKSIFKIYSNEKDLNPVLINSQTKNKKEVLAAIRNREHKIIVCVDMLGEGFDLPQLKISALHDPHKSINIMLQFTGRFTRTTKNVGDAKFIANIANPNMSDSLEELYKEDSDWNSVISDISSRKIQDEREYHEFRSEFSTPSKLLDLGLTPSISSTIYRVSLGQWQPNNFISFGNKHFQIVDSTINDDQDILIFSVKSFLPVGWTSSKELFDESWDLYIAYYNKELNLLFIHSSAKDGLVKRLVKLVAPDASLVQGEYVFRALAGLKRLKLQNVGLNKNKRGLRYSMHTGTEVNDQIPDIEANRATKSNIFGKGYENGELVSIGCSHKGKVWAMDSDSLDKWITWCKNVGKKILDDSINTNEVMKTAMQTEELDKYPDLHPLSIEWPVELLRKNELKVTVLSDTWEEKLIQCELILIDKTNIDNKSMTIGIKTQHGTNLITAKIHKKGEVIFHSTENIKINLGDSIINITDYFNENPPTIFMSDTSVVDGGLRYYPNEKYAYLYDKNNVEDWEWTGVDISIESQTESKIKNSIQYYTIQRLLNHYDIVFDDDGAGEVADIVAIKNIDNRELVIDLFHCKYCTRSNGIAKPGARVDDVYQVAGQAEKSVKWLGDKENLILRLMQRERSRLKNGRTSRIEKGQFEDLVQLAKIARYASFKCGISVVQPAISKRIISDDQLTVLGATAAYIDEISGIKLRVITNI